MAVDIFQRYGESADNCHLVFLNQHLLHISIENSNISSVLVREIFCFEKCSVVIIPHVQSFGTLVDTLKASNVSAYHPYINFCAVTSLASSSTVRYPVPPSDTLPSVQRLVSETHPIIQWPCFNRLRYQNTLYFSCFPC
jgi:hypothetical protein